MDEDAIRSCIERYLESKAVTGHLQLGTRPDRPPTATIGGLDLYQTCSACPEQYDVFLGELPVAYLRLRHGWFRADVPACGGDTVYKAMPEECDGEFVSDGQRARYLAEAVLAIHQYYEKGASDE